MHSLGLGNLSTAISLSRAFFRSSIGPISHVRLQ